MPLLGLVSEEDWAIPGWQCGNYRPWLKFPDVSRCGWWEPRETPHGQMVEPLSRKTDDDGPLLPQALNLYFSTNCI